MSARYTLTFRQDHADQLGRLLFERSDIETAAFVLCGVAESRDECRLLSRAVIEIDARSYARRNLDGLTLNSEVYVGPLKRARREREALLLVHSHPLGPLGFSRQDDREDARLFEAVHRRAPGLPHGSLVFTASERLVGRIWPAMGEPMPIERVMAVGDRLRVLDHQGDAPPRFLDRQVRAIGTDAQSVLGHLRVGVVGAGGTGSPTIEQLLRLGVGEVVVVDFDRFEETDINRGYGTRLSDTGVPKVEIAARTAALTGLPSKLTPIQGNIIHQSVARRLRFCDAIFGCTDRELPRLILGRLATRYLIPVLDTGVVIASVDGKITGVDGRVTRISAGTACLLCRERITPARLAAETMPTDERERLAAEGYVPELPGAVPAVVPFTTTVSGLAVSEFLNMVTGFMGQRKTSELVVQFDPPYIRPNSEAASAQCDCANEERWGRGDESPFLGLTWQSEKAVDA